MNKAKAKLVYAGVALAAFVIFGFDLEILIGFALGYYGRGLFIAAVFGAAIAILAAFTAYQAAVMGAGIFGALVGTLFLALGASAIVVAVLYAALSSGAGWYLGRKARMG